MKDIDFDELDRAITSVLGKNNQQSSALVDKTADAPAPVAAPAEPIVPPAPDVASQSAPVEPVATPTLAVPNPAEATVSVPAAAPTRPDRMASSSLHARTMFGNRQRAARPAKPTASAAPASDIPAMVIEPIAPIEPGAPAESIAPQPEPQKAAVPDQPAIDDEALARKAAEAFPFGATYAAKHNKAKRRREAIDTAIEEVEDLVADSMIDEPTVEMAESTEVSTPVNLSEAAPTVVNVPAAEAEAVDDNSDNMAPAETDEMSADAHTTMPPRRVHGRFMDVIHPSSDMRHLTGASRMVQPARHVDLAMADRSAATDRSAQTDADKAMEQEVHATLGRGVVIDPPHADEAESVQTEAPVDTAAMPPIDMATAMKHELDTLKIEAADAALPADAPAVDVAPVAEVSALPVESAEQSMDTVEDVASSDVADRLVAEIEAVEAIENEAQAAPVMQESTQAPVEPAPESTVETKQPATRPIAVPKVASMAQRQAATQDQPATEEYPVFDAESHRLPATGSKKKTALWGILTVLILLSLLAALGVIGWVLFTL